MSRGPDGVRSPRARVAVAGADRPEVPSPGPVGDELAPLSPVAYVSRRLRGEYHVDPWGLDADVVRTLAPLGRARWSLDVEGLDRLPTTGALLVHNQGWGWVGRAAVSAAVHRATGRVVRFVGVPDVVVLGPVLRGLGGVADHPAEVRGLLRSGQLVSVGAGRERLDRRFAGAVLPASVQPALDLGVPVLPVAVTSGRWGVRWAVHVGAPVTPPEHHDPLAATELAEQVRAGLQALLDDPWG